LLSFAKSQELFINYLNPEVDYSGRMIHWTEMAQSFFGQVQQLK